MRKQYCLEWTTRSGRVNGTWKSIGHDCPELAEKALQKKIKAKSTLSAWITWNYVGSDMPEEEFGVDHFYKGFYKHTLDVMGMKVIIQNDIREMEG